MLMESSKGMLDQKFVHVMHDMWTRKDKNYYLGFSYSFIYNWESIRIFLGLVKNNQGHEAEINAVLMEHNLLQQIKFDFSKWCHTVVSDMTACAVNVTMKFSEDSIQVDCKMHQLNTCLKYGLGLYENTSTKFAKDGNENFLLDDTGNRYKITTFTTPGGEFIDGKRIITS